MRMRFWRRPVTLARCHRNARRSRACRGLRLRYTRHIVNYGLVKGSDMEVWRTVRATSWSTRAVIAAGVLAVLLVAAVPAAFWPA